MWRLWLLLIEVCCANFFLTFLLSNERSDSVPKLLWDFASTSSMFTWALGGKDWFLYACYFSVSYVAFLYSKSLAANQLPPPRSNLPIIRKSRAALFSAFDRFVCDRLLSVRSLSLLLLSVFYAYLYAVLLVNVRLKLDFPLLLISFPSRACGISLLPFYM